jgi:Mrp family chromosome partitioning ATPase/capsular polysaccharide biosynthesis protein
MTEIDETRREGVKAEDYLKVLRDRLWIIVSCVVIVFVVVLITSLTTTPLYSATSEVIYDKRSMDTAVIGFELSGYDYDRSRTIEAAIAAIGKNESIAEGVHTQLTEKGLAGADLSAEDLSGMVSASAGDESDLVSISAVSTDPDEAAAVADAFADQFMIYRKNQARALVAEAADTINQELRAMTPSEKSSGYGLMMQDKFESLRIMESMQDGDFKLLSRASVPGAPFTPQTKRNVILALVLGLALGVGLAFLLEYLDKRIKDEKTLEKVSGLPVLAGVPILGRSWRSLKSSERSLDVIGFAGDRSPLLESFRTLRSALQYFNVDGSLRKILVTSGLPVEGKTVTTINLGISLAMSGKRVIILEADLRRPMVHEYLGLENENGLSNLLAGRSSVASAMQLVPMDPLIPARSRKGEKGSPLVIRKNLYCITSGPLPPNPTELLQSARMAEIIAELERLADYVLVDTPPVLPVSDAVALAPNVDAVILAARLNASTRGEIEQVCDVLLRAGARVIGVVAGGIKVGRSHYYRRGYSYQYGGYGY